MSQLLNNREQKIFVICLMVVGVTVVYNGLIAPLQREKIFLQEEITIEKQKLNGSRQIIERSEKFDARYNSYLKRFGKSGTGEQVASSMLSEIEHVASKLKLPIAELKPEKIEHNEFDDRFAVRLTMNGEFLDIIHFLYTLQQAPYLFDVEEVEFKKSARRKQGKITTHLVLGKDFILMGSNGRIEDRGEAL